MKLIEMQGRRFGRLTVLSRGPQANKDIKWLCRCECGTEKLVHGTALRRQMTISCGCHRKERMTKHGHASDGKRNPAYGIWSAMKDRCFNPSNPEYSAYGGRGIVVCDAWRRSFTRFLDDMGERPSRGHSIDRINNDRGYEPQNCRWATRQEQDRNRRNVRLVEYCGAMMTIREAVKSAGNVTVLATARWRIKRGWPISEAVETVAA